MYHLQGHKVLSTLAMWRLRSPSLACHSLFGFDDDCFCDYRYCQVSWLKQYIRNLPLATLKIVSCSEIIAEPSIHKAVAGEVHFQGQISLNSVHLGPWLPVCLPRLSRQPCVMSLHDVNRDQPTTTSHLDVTR